MRVVDYAAVAGKDLRRQFLRSLLTIIALSISTVILVTMAALAFGGRQAIVDQFGSGGALSTITVTPNQSSAGLSPFGQVQQVNSQATTLTDTTATQLAKLPHVQSSVPRAHLWEFNNFSVAGFDKQFVAQTEGVPGDDQVGLKAGAHFASNDAKNVVILGLAYAKELGLANDPQQLVGKSISITTQKGYRGDGAAIPSAGASQQTIEKFNQSTTTISATIVGVTDNGPDQNSLLVPLGWAHGIRTTTYKGYEGTKVADQLASDGYTTIRVQVDTTANVKSVSQAISQLGYGQVSALDQVEHIQQLTTILWVILGAVALVAAVAAALGVTNTMLMTVSEQRYTIGVWRAVGAQRGVIVRMFLVQAGLLGLVGGLIGVGIGIIISRYVNNYVNTLLTSQGLSVTNIATIPFWLAAGAIVLTTAFGIVAGLYPAYRAARQDPSEALSSGQ